MTVELTPAQRANRVQWVRDLVSGDFRQATGGLVVRDWDTGAVDGYCCLGVAALGIGREHLYEDGRPSQSRALIDDDLAWHEFRLSREDQERAAGWNDSDDLTFAQIADRVAYATVHELNFAQVSGAVIPSGYAVAWLAELD